MAAEGDKANQRSKFVYLPLIPLDPKQILRFCIRSSSMYSSSQCGQFQLRAVASNARNLRMRDARTRDIRFDSAFRDTRAVNKRNRLDYVAITFANTMNNRIRVCDCPEIER